MRTQFQFKLIVFYFQIIVLFTSCTSFQKAEVKRTIAHSNELVDTAENSQSVVLLCLDGVGYNLLKRIDPDFIQSFHVQPLKPPFPSNSFPSQMSIVTGLPPEIHGIADNKFRIPEYDFKEVDVPLSNQYLLKEPIWSEISQKNVDVYTMAYMQSAQPWPVEQVDHLKDKHHSIPFDKSDSLDTKLNKVLELQNTTSNKKQLFIIWDYALDFQEHSGFNLNDEKGKDFIRIKNKWELIKSNILKFYSQLKKSTKVVVVSDHGMDYVDQKVNIPNLLNELNISNLKYTHSSGIIHLYDLKSNYEIDLISNYLANKNIKIEWHSNGDVSLESKTRMGVVGELQVHTIFDKDILEDKSTVVLPMSKILGNHGWNPNQNGNMNGVFWEFANFDSENTKLEPPKSVIDIKTFINQILNY